ncbi:hypothetical protein [Lelliottia wanjuensis]|uniref:hypothetical protein n=1 Tax=Lelliottia wanjuensis TaxID=3050585 RepID=UPI00255069C4|nr:hypothetical protein [Lelliottia sp. V86_10]
MTENKKSSLSDTGTLVFRFLVIGLLMALIHAIHQNTEAANGLFQASRVLIEDMQSLLSTHVTMK